MEISDLSKYTTEARGQINKIYIHWTAGFYDQHFSDYHINIHGDGSLWTDMDSLTERKSHTWLRNTGAIGIACCCCYKAEPIPNGNDWVTDYGDYPPTPEQYDTLARVIAKLCIEIGLPLNAYTVMTHDEAARNVDGGITHPYYGLGATGDIRWDFYGEGASIREKALNYYNLWSNSSISTGA